MQTKVIVVVSAIATTAAISASFGAGYWLSGALHDNESLRTANADYVAQKQADDKLRDALAAKDKKHFEELSNARIENDKLRLDLAAGTKRVRVAVRQCEPSGASGVDNAASTAELDGKTAADLAGIAADGDEAIRQLTALQEWAKTVTGSTAKGGDPVSQAQ